MGKIKINLLIIIIIVLVLIATAIILNIDRLLERSDFGKVEIAKEIYGFSAKIKRITEQTLTLEASIPMADSSQEAAKGTLKVSVSDKTTIVRLKFPETITNTQKPVYPESSLADLSELKVGDRIDISSQENLSDKIKAGVKFPVKLIYIIEN